MKINPLEVKHLNCKWCLVPGNFGPHKGKFICEEHNAFLRWAPQYLFNDDPDPKGLVFIERQKHKIGNYLFEQGDLFDKMKYQEFNKKPPYEKAQKIIDYLKTINQEN